MYFKKQIMKKKENFDLNNFGILNENEDKDFKHYINKEEQEKIEKIKEKKLYIKYKNLILQKIKNLKEIKILPVE
jgi:hypothetical protein